MLHSPIEMLKGLYPVLVITSSAFNPLPDNKILDRSKLKHSAGSNFKFDENSRKFSKWVENTVGKGKIARYEQFLLFPQCFQKACFPGASKGVIVWEWVNLFPNKPFFCVCSSRATSPFPTASSFHFEKVL